MVDVPILTKEQLALLTASPAHESFDGDARKFCLGIEAMRLWLAYGYDPYFSLDTHIKGVLCAINAAFKGMIAKKKGHTVNLGSVASRVAIPNGAVYWGTKFAVAAISKALRKEVAADGIRVAIIK